MHYLYTAGLLAIVALAASIWGLKTGHPDVTLILVSAMGGALGIGLHFFFKNRHSHN